MRLGYGAFRVLGQSGLKLRLAERAAKRRDRFPDGAVDEDTATRDTAMHLSRDESGLPFHKSGVGGPRRKQRVGFAGIDVELVYENDRAEIARHLLPQRNEAVHLVEFHR